jgi:signal transduction histidine kinase
LYDAVQDLQRAQAELVEQSDRDRVVADLVRDFRQEIEPGLLRDRACAGLLAALRVDRCEVVVELEEEHPALAERLQQLGHPVDGVWVEHLAQPELAGDVWGTAFGCEPILVGAEALGWLLVVSQTPRAWTARDRSIVRGVARDLGASLVQANAWEQQQRTLQRLRELDQAKSDFVATVSHELRTPLSSIRGYTELLRDGMLGALDGQQGKAIEVIDRNADRLLRVVGDLLTLAEVDSGASARREAWEPVDLAAVVEESYRSIEPILESRSLDVRVRIGVHVPLVNGVASHLDRVVLNLMSNAVKFTEDSGTVEVGLDQELRHGAAYVVPCVRDSGIGISGDQQHRIFDRFFRSVEAQQRAIQGTGLGLAVCKAIVEAHGGEITIDSETGVGTTVTVTLPAMAAPTVVDALAGDMGHNLTV